MFVYYAIKTYRKIYSLYKRKSGYNYKKMPYEVTKR
nr:MAG TPA: hypothetical protein [Caudoviricetes sp.]